MCKYHVLNGKGRLLKLFKWVMLGVNFAFVHHRLFGIQWFITKIIVVLRNMHELAFSNINKISNKNRRSLGP